MRPPWRRRVADRASSCDLAPWANYRPKNGQLYAHQEEWPSFRSASPAMHGEGNIVGVEPGLVGPTVLVVVGHALIGECDHLVEGAGATGIEHALDADVFVVAGVVHLIELVPAAEFGA